MIWIKSVDILERSGGQFRWEASLQSNRYGSALFKCGIRLWTFILIVVIVSNLNVYTKRDLIKTCFPACMCTFMSQPWCECVYGCVRHSVCLAWEYYVNGCIAGSIGAMCDFFFTECCGNCNNNFPILQMQQYSKCYSISFVCKCLYLASASDGVFCNYLFEVLWILNL